MEGKEVEGEGGMEEGEEEEGEGGKGKKNDLRVVW